MAMTMNDADMVTVYGNDRCPFCVKAKEYLENNKIPVTYISLVKEEEDGESIQDVRNKLKNMGIASYEVTTIPQIFATVKDKDYYIGGFGELVSISINTNTNS